MLINGIYHIGCIGNYRTVIEEQLSLFHKNDLMGGNLYHRIDKLIIFLTDLSEKDFIKKFDPEDKFEFYLVPLVERENYTINHFRSYLSENVDIIFYFHTKGVSRKEFVFQECRKI